MAGDLCRDCSPRRAGCSFPAFCGTGILVYPEPRRACALGFPNFHFQISNFRFPPRRHPHFSPLVIPPALLAPIFEGSGVEGSAPAVEGSWLDRSSPHSMASSLHPPLPLLFNPLTFEPLHSSTRTPIIFLTQNAASYGICPWAPNA